VLDAAPLVVVNAGHSRDEIVAAITRSVDARLRADLPDGHRRIRTASESRGTHAAGLDRIFFTNSGSESVDTALKIALAYNTRARRRPPKLIAVIGGSSTVGLRWPSRARGVRDADLSAVSTDSNPEFRERHTVDAAA